MRSAYLLASLCLAFSAPVSVAQQNRPPSQEAPSGTAGPVVDGRHRQPSAAEIESRERAGSASEKAIQDRARQDDKAIDDLYKELVTPVPPREQSGQSGEPMR
jgi:hypothetical protein